MCGRGERFTQSIRFCSLSIFFRSIAYTALLLGTAAMKRKSGQHRPDKRKQARADESSGPVIRDGVSFTQLELAPTQVPTLLLLLLLLLLLRLLQQQPSAPNLVLMRRVTVYDIC
jgi:hypothetical protein